MAALLSFDHVSFEYNTGQMPSIPAIRDLSLTIGEGEFVAVVGSNGSGKSTFARLAAALLVPNSGTVSVMGLDTKDPANQARVHSSVGIVFQHPEDQIVGNTVEEDTAFGPENLGLPSAEIRSRVEEALQIVNLWEQRMRPPHMLSGGQTQRLALAGVLAMRPHCILYDEASTMLDPVGRRILMETMQRLVSEGLTVIFITHYMDEAACAKRAIVFNEGRVVLDAAPQEVFSDAASLALWGLEQPPALRLANALRSTMPGLPSGLITLDEIIAALPDYRGASLEDLPAFISQPVDKASLLVDVEGLGHTYLKGSPLAHRALSNAALQVVEGQGHGLLGRTGSGKSTLMQHLNALLRPQEGRVRVGLFNLNDPTVRRKDVVRQVGLVFQNPEAQFFEHFVGDEIAFGPRQFPTGEALRDRVRWAMEMVGLDFEKFKDRPLFALSGGERRKVALASTLAIKPTTLLLDEPTAGLDPRSRRDLIDHLKAMEAGGMTLILSSHQMEDLVVLARRLTVYDYGKDVMAGETAQVYSRAGELRSHGLEPPAAARAAEALRMKGWPLSGRVMSITRLGEEIRAAVKAEGAQ